MSKHTPGPWVISHPNGPSNGISIESTGEWPRLPEAWLGCRATSEEQIANARLIAAAPELLESLKLAKLCIEAMIEDGRCGETFVGAALTLDKINLAIAKAEGGGE